MGVFRRHNCWLHAPHLCFKTRRKNEITTIRRRASLADYDERGEVDLTYDMRLFLKTSRQRPAPGRRWVWPGKERLIIFRKYSKSRHRPSKQLENKLAHEIPFWLTRQLGMINPRCGCQCVNKVQSIARILRSTRPGCYGGGGARGKDPIASNFYSADANMQNLFFLRCITIRSC